MKVAIYGQYYQNSTEPIIKDIFIFFNSNNVEMVIEENFLKSKINIQRPSPLEINTRTWNTAAEVKVEQRVRLVLKERW